MLGEWVKVTFASMHKELHISLEDFNRSFRAIQINRINIHERLLNKLDCKIYKYIPIAYLIELLHSKQLFVANRASFKDKREQGHKENIRNMFAFLPAKNDATHNDDWREAQLLKLHEAYKLCISCWTEDIHGKCDESIMNWNCYGSDTCRIETTISKLANCLSPNCKDILIAPVQYDKEKSDSCIELRIFSKHLAYQEEQEIRLCVLSLEQYEMFDFDVETAITKIRISPYLPNSLKTSLESLFPFLKGRVEFSHIIEKK